jgi:hypothetical protein
MILDTSNGRYQKGSSPGFVPFESIAAQLEEGFDSYAIIVFRQQIKYFPSFSPEKPVSALVDASIN